MSAKANLSLPDWQSKRFDDFPRDRDPALRAHFSAALSKFGFRQEIDDIAADSGFPVQAIGGIQNHFVLFRLAIEPGRGADECIYVFEVVVYATFFIGNDDCRMRPLFPKRKKIYFPLPHFTILRTDRAASLLDS